MSPEIEQELKVIGKQLKQVLNILTVIVCAVIGWLLGHMVAALV